MYSYSDQQMPEYFYLELMHGSLRSSQAKRDKISARSEIDQIAEVDLLALKYRLIWKFYADTV